MEIQFYLINLFHNCNDCFHMKLLVQDPFNMFYLIVYGAQVLLYRYPSNLILILILNKIIQIMATPSGKIIYQGRGNSHSQHSQYDVVVLKNPIVDLKFKIQQKQFTKKTTNHSSVQKQTKKIEDSLGIVKELENEDNLQNKEESDLAIKDQVHSKLKEEEFQSQSSLSKMSSFPIIQSLQSEDILSNSSGYVHCSTEKCSPEKCIGIIKAIWTSQANKTIVKSVCYGTAFLVTPRLLLTCGHCVFHDKLRRICDRIQFVPNINGNFNKDTDTIYETVNSKMISFQKGNISFLSEPLLNDIAMIRLKKPVAGGHYLKIGLFQNNLPEKKKLSITGYPSFRFTNTTTWADIDAKKQRLQGTTVQIANPKPHVLYHNLPTKVGHSGSPIVIKVRGQYYVVGMHTHKQNQRDKYCGLAFNSKMVHKIQAFQHQLTKEQEKRILTISDFRTLSLAKPQQFASSSLQESEIISKELEYQPSVIYQDNKKLVEEEVQNYVSSNSDMESFVNSDMEKFTNIIEKQQKITTTTQNLQSISEFLSQRIGAFDELILLMRRIKKTYEDCSDHVQAEINKTEKLKEIKKIIIKVEQNIKGKLDQIFLLITQKYNENYIQTVQISNPKCSIQQIQKVRIEVSYEQTKNKEIIMYPSPSNFSENRLLLEFQKQKKQKEIQIICSNLKEMKRMMTLKQKGFLNNIDNIYRKPNFHSNIKNMNIKDVALQQKERQSENSNSTTEECSKIIE